jgi:hypothetical protein
MHLRSYDARADDGGRMPASNPRITITLAPQVHAILRRLSQLTGNSQSGLVAELLLESMPVFERMGQVLEAAEKLKAEADAGKASIKEGLAHAQGKLERQLGLVLDTWDEGAKPILEAAERIDRRRGRLARTGRRAAAPTPMSNRGVTPQPKREAKATARARKGGR